MRNNPLGRAMQIRGATPDSYHLPQSPLGTVADHEQKDDLLIRHLWEKGTNCILDMRVVNTDAVSYIIKKP